MKKKILHRKEYGESRSLIIFAIIYDNRIRKIILLFTTERLVDRPRLDRILDNEINTLLIFIILL